MFYLAGIVVTFFLVTILVSKKNKTEADKILALWLIAIGIHLTLFYLFITRQVFAYPHLLGLEIPIPLMHGPLLYAYTLSVTESLPFRRWRLLHLVPVLLAYIIVMPFLLSPEEHKIFVYENRGLGYETPKRLMLWAIIISGISYVALSLRVLAKHTQIVKNQFSYAERINLAWLRYLIYGIGAIWVCVIFRNDIAVFSSVVLFVIFLGYFGIKQVGIFTQAFPGDLPSGPAAEIQEETPSHSLAEPRKTKYLKSGLDAASSESIYRTLVQSMHEKRYYTNPELTLAELARALSVHPNNLSQVINTHEQKSFYDYINSMRVEEFKRIVSLPENQKFTLLGLAQDCGFNSKTSFNRNFKNATGLSPTEYLKQANILLGQ